MQQPVTLNGHVYGPQGNPLINQTVYLQTSGGARTTATTDSSGDYSLQVAPGTYILDISSYNGAVNHPPVNAPQYYELKKSNYSLTQNTTLDITVPAKKLDIHVQDPQGVAVNNAAIQATHPCGWGCLANVDGLSIGGGITDARGESLYGYIDPAPVTDSSGNVTLWLFPNNFDKSYDIAATPPSGNIYNQFILNNVVVTGNQNELISLQYNHDTPITTASLATKNSDGTYASPTTATLSATAASGYTVANTYYTIDGGTQQTYSSPLPFTISGVGEHTITYWSIDNSGVQETHNSKTFTIAAVPTPTPTQLTSLSRAKVWVGVKNSDDVGIKFDLKAEIYKDNTLISSGEIDSVSGGSSGFAHAQLDTIPFNSFSPINFPADSQLKIKLYARNACSGSGKNSGTARLWYNDSQANSKLAATIATNTSDYFLLNNSTLGTSSGTGPKLTSDLSAGAKCSPFKSFGTWTITP